MQGDTDFASALRVRFWKKVTRIIVATLCVIFALSVTDIISNPVLNLILLSNYPLFLMGIVIGFVFAVFFDVSAKSKSSLKKYNVSKANDTQSKISSSYKSSAHREQGMSGDGIVSAGKEHKINVNKNSTTDVKADVVFILSLDEETTQVILERESQTIDLQIRAHHYLMLVLARCRIEDAKKGLDKSSQGWIYTEQLSKYLGIDNCHINIQIHRARKQFSKVLGCDVNDEYLIQRQPGKVRFSGESCRIYKGEKLEGELRE